MQDRLRDFLQVMRRAFKESFSKIGKMYIAFIFILLRSFFENYRFRAMFGGNMVAGLIDYFIDVLFLCFIAQSLRSVVMYGNSGKKSVENSISNFFQPLLSSFFYVYLIQMVLRMVSFALPSGIYLLIMAVFEFFMTALLEEIYINGKSGFDAVRESAKFVCDNIMIYGLFALIFVLVESNLTIKMALGASYGFRGVGTLFIVAIIDTIFYLIRGHLFKLLNNHSYRQRRFMRG